MNCTPTEQRLLDELAAMEVVDAHEHLPREATRLQEPADALTFYRQYTRLVMFSAGLEETTFLRMHDPQVPWEERFGIFEQYRDLIRCSGADRAARIALERFYGEKELTRTNFEQITAQVREFYRPGLYRKVLAEACGIRTVLQNSDDPGWEEPLFRVVPMLGIGGEWHSYRDLARQIINGEHGFADLDEYLQDRRDRLIAFGGDVRWPVEKVYGHLTLAREVVAVVLARRIDRGLFDLDHALWLARRFFIDNPSELYGLRRLAEEV